MLDSEPFSSPDVQRGIGTSSDEQSSTRFLMEQVRARILLVMILLLLPQMAFSSVIMDHYRGSQIVPIHLAVPQDGASQTLFDGAVVQYSASEHDRGSVILTDGHRCNDGGCSSPGCCVVSDGYFPAENIRPVVARVATLLASVTEAFLSFDTRPPIRSV